MDSKNKTKCLLDTNIVIDEILSRPRLKKIVELVFSEYDEFFISAKTFSTCFYLLRKLGLEKEVIYKHLKKYRILSVNEEICITGYKWSKNSQDVEDCIEIAIAFSFNCVFITADSALEKYSSLSKIEIIE
jgi:predicted nucleic acid-binding protein